MFNNVEVEKLAEIELFKLEIDRILIFVGEMYEIEAFRKLNFHHFEFITRNSKEGTVSHIFFVGDIGIELIAIENQNSSTLSCTKTNANFVLCRPWKREGFLPFGFILNYANSQEFESRRRCYNTSKKRFFHSHSSLQVEFSPENLQKIKEPACYIVPQSLTSKNLLDSRSTIKQRVLFQKSKINKLTNIQITLNISDSLTNTVSLLSDLTLVNIELGNDPQLELEFDNNRRQFIAPFSSITVKIYY